MNFTTSASILLNTNQRVHGPQDLYKAQKEMTDILIKLNKKLKEKNKEQKIPFMKIPFIVTAGSIPTGTNWDYATKVGLILTTSIPQTQSWDPKNIIDTDEWKDSIEQYPKELFNIDKIKANNSSIVINYSNGQVYEYDDESWD